MIKAAPGSRYDLTRGLPIADTRIEGDTTNQHFRVQARPVKFDPRPVHVVKSIAQRGLLKWWSRPAAHGPLPSRADAEDEELARLAHDLALYQVQHDEGRPRYKCLRHGAGLRPIDGGDLTGRLSRRVLPRN